jgi:hypothetical protein
MNRVRHAVWAFLALVVLTPTSGLSQTQTSTGTAQPTDTAAQNPADSPAFTQQQPNPAATSEGLFVRALNSASALSEESGPLHWGWFSVRSASFLQYYSAVSFGNPSIQPQSEIIRSSQFSTSLVLDHVFKTTHFSLQYAPSLFITNGNLYSNALNQTAGLDTTFALSARWNLQLTDRFSYYASQRNFSDFSSDTNFLTGTSVQNNFLNGPGSVMVNSIAVPISYLWSARTKISFAPSFEYQYSQGAVVSSNASLKGLYEGGQFTLSHAISPTQTVGLSYLGQYASYTNSSPQAGPRSNAFLEDFLLTYTQQLGASWHINLGLGVSDNVSLNGTGTSGGALLAANAGITKTFHRSDFTVNYDRGHQFNGFITNSASDRIDVAQRIYWTPRFSTSTSVAYFKTTASLSPSQSASYATERVSFALTRQLSVSASGSYSKQTGDGVFVVSGIRRFVTVGLTWSPQPITPARN